MAIIGALLSVLFITIAAYLLLKNYNAQAVLLFCGLLMIFLAIVLDIKLDNPDENNSFLLFDLFEILKNSFSSKLSEIGLMIMVIGGFVTYMDHIGASKTLVYLSMKPLSIFKNNPYLAASLVIPIGHLLSIPIPSATGLGLLLIASVFPVLVQLGVSKVSAVSVIVSTTIFDMGPASANTLLAAELAGKSNIMYFIEDQFSAAVPLIILSAIVYFFVNKHYDKSLNEDSSPRPVAILKPETPLIYAILPIFPLVLLLAFSELFTFFDPVIQLSTTTAMLISMGLAMLFEFLYKRNIKLVMDSLTVFWNAMGKVFASVVTLIIAADLFSEGLISLGFISFLVNMSQEMGIASLGIGILMITLIFFASILMGSGNASFYSFGPLVPDIAAKIGVDPTSIILPMQLSASLGRGLSPIAGVIIATSEIAGVTPMQVVKRNLIPLIVTFVGLLLMSL
jgi:DcuC family C4-dicarboxylate transporter